MQRNFAPMRSQVELWRQSELTDRHGKDDHPPGVHPSGVHRKRIGGSAALARRVHDLYFDPQYDQFKSRTVYLSNAFTSASKDLDPIPQFKATAKLSGSLEERYPREF